MSEDEDIGYFEIKKKTKVFWNKKTGSCYQLRILIYK